MAFDVKRFVLYLILQLLSSVSLCVVQVSDIDSLSDSGLKPSSLTGNIEIADVKFKYPTRPDVQVEASLLSYFPETAFYYISSFIIYLIINRQYIIARH